MRHLIRDRWNITDIKIQKVRFHLLLYFQMRNGKYTRQVWNILSCQKVKKLLMTTKVFVGL